MAEFREYQLAAVEGVFARLSAGRSCCLVSPTGSGKTVMGAEVARRYSRVLWLCNRVDLLLQTKELLPEFTVASVLSKKKVEGVDLVVIDECHHTPAQSWGVVLGMYPEAKILGLTATPQRADGAALSMFSSLVVAAQYSELLEAGYIAPCRVFRPTKQIEKGIALDPVVAYKRYASGMKGFLFVPTVKYGRELLERFTALGVRAAIITAKTSRTDRKAYVAALADAELDLLVNCTTLTEGLDIASAEVCILARRCAHSGLYLQIVGRVLRSCVGKKFATLIDLTGASERHGLPTQDREYSLEGTPIRAKPTPVRQCYRCGAVMEAYHKMCITCGVAFIPGVHRPPAIKNIELAEVYNGCDTPDPAKQAELERLTSNGNFGKAAKRYVELFGERPAQRQWAALPQSTILTEYRRLAKFRTKWQTKAIMKTYTGR